MTIMSRYSKAYIDNFDAIFRKKDVNPNKEHGSAPEQQNRTAIERALPEGRTCNDCLHALRCVVDGKTHTKATICNYLPSMFALNPVSER